MRSNALILLAIASLAAVPLQEAKAAIDLKTAGTYAVLAGTTVTNTGATTLNGDLGLNWGTSITGTGTITFTAGTIHATDTPSGIAKVDLTTAYNVAAGLAPTQTMTGPQLGGLTLTPGVYFLSGQGLLTGTLTLDAQNNPNAEFVFQIGSELITSSSSSVVTIAGGSTPAGSNVFWQVGSSATLNNHRIPRPHSRADQCRYEDWRNHNQRKRHGEEWRGDTRGQHHLRGARTCDNGSGSLRRRAVFNEAIASRRPLMSA